MRKRATSHPPEKSAKTLARSSVRQRRSATGLIKRQFGQGGFPSVWPCGQDKNQADAGLISGWLLTAVIRVVTTYSTPGDRILLLAPPRTVRRPGSYSALPEASWPVIRLGRGVQTALAGSPSDSDHGEHFSDNDLFDVIIAAVEPDVVTRFRPTSWSRLLSPLGTFFVITHSDRTGGRLHDPSGALVRAAKIDGLRYLDHIALLQATADGRSAKPREDARRLPEYADLHVFGRRETSDE
jgi:hypothetical protein